MLKYGFIIDTDSYSGNFERQMCAYITGQIGDCCVGDEYVEEFIEQFPDEYALIENIIGFEADEYGCSRPCGISPTPGRFNHGMGENFDDDADMDVVKASYIKKTDEYYLPLLKRAEKAIADGKTEWENDAQGYRDRMREAREDKIRKYHAYESVEIHFNEKPSEEIIEFMKKRAKEYSETQPNYAKIYCKILGFRLEESATTTTDTAI